MATALEKTIQSNCSPARLGVMPANIECCINGSHTNFDSQISELNLHLNRKMFFGQSFTTKTSRNTLSTSYLKQFVDIFSTASSVAFLNKIYGCPVSGERNAFILHLKHRLHKFPNFPHETSVFLGYSIDHKSSASFHANGTGKGTRTVVPFHRTNDTGKAVYDSFTKAI